MVRQREVGNGLASCAKTSHTSKKCLAKRSPAMGREADANPLFEVDEMWRGVEACFAREAGSCAERSKKRIHKRARPSLRLGTCDMNDVEVVDVGSLSRVSGVRMTSRRDVLSGRCGEASASFPRCSGSPSGASEMRLMPGAVFSASVLGLSLGGAGCGASR